MKYRYLILVLALLVGLAVLPFIVREPCKEVSEERVNVEILKCFLTVDEETLRAEICAFLEREKNCAISNSDRDAFDTVIRSNIERCTISNLKKNNLCVDKVKQVVDFIFKGKTER